MTKREKDFKKRIFGAYSGENYNEWLITHHFNDGSVLARKLNSYRSYSVWRHHQIFGWLNY